MRLRTPFPSAAFYLDKHSGDAGALYESHGRQSLETQGQKSPVERTQWTDAVRFCNKCSELDGLTPCYNLDDLGVQLRRQRLRLPTEAEWEYACRAGGTGKYSFGDDETELPQYAWFKPHSQGKPRPLGQKLPNRWGLYEMHGNVWQWCNDWYSETYYAESPTEDPRGPATGKMRVLRGGAWDCTAEKLRSAYRHKEFPVYSDACFGADSYGFRRARKADGGDSTRGRGRTRPRVLQPDPDKTAPTRTPPVATGESRPQIDLASSRERSSSSAIAAAA